MPSAEPGESGLAPVYGVYVGKRTPPTTTAAPGAEPAPTAAAAAAPAVGAAPAGFAAPAAVGAGVGAGRAVGVGVGTGALHAASNGRVTEARVSLPSI